MDDRVGSITNLLLRVGVLDPDHADHRSVFEELMSTPSLYEGVRERLAGVGYELVQFLGYMGVRLDRQAETGAPGLPPGTGDLQAHHIRLIVWLWVQLVYRQIEATRRDQDAEPIPGRRQRALDLGDISIEEDRPSIPAAEVASEFGTEYPAATIRSMLTTLKKQRFVRQDGSGGPISAGPSLYVLIDPLRMEEFVVGLARRGAGPLAPQAREGE